MKTKRSPIVLLPAATALLLGIGLTGAGARTGYAAPASSPVTRAAGGRLGGDSFRVALQDGASGREVSGKPGDAGIARLTARTLDERAYVQLPDHAAVSARLLDGYLNALDPLHFYFTEQDVKEFDQWRNTLDPMLIEKGDVSPAYTMFARYLERVDQNVAFVNEQLKAADFHFDQDDSFQIDRKGAPRPANLDAAKALWKDRLRYEYLQEKLNKQKPEEIVKTLTRRYARLGKSAHDYTTDDQLTTYLNALAHVYDPHSDYMDKSALADLRVSTGLSLFGIGARLQSEDGYCTIVGLTPGSPAMKSHKLKVGDRIIAVAQGNGEAVDVVDMKLDRVTSLIRGEKGTEVKLTIIPAGSTDPSTREVVSLVRDEIKLDDMGAKAAIVDLPVANGKTRRLGVIDLPSFYASDAGNSASRDIEKLLVKLQKEHVQGVILDLRGNGGGLLTEAIDVAGLFIRRGPVVQERNLVQAVSVDRSHQAVPSYEGPMIVLIDRFSASASEIVAGALQDYGRAVVVGDTSTWGKGTVQGVLPLNNGTALKLTTEMFFRPGGASTQRKGVESDVVLPSLSEYSLPGEKSDENALPWAEVKPAPFDKLNRVSPYVTELKKRSESRITADPDFAILRQEIARYRKLLDQKSISLNEQRRLKEKDESAAEVEAIRKKLAARKVTAGKIYKITVQQAGQPGLPAPVTGNEPDPKTPMSATAEPIPVELKDSRYDILLTETERILSDYIDLSAAKRNDATAAR